MPWNLQNLQFIKQLKGKITITKLLLNYNYTRFFFLLVKNWGK